jgi:large subunit ribosomal protein L6
MNVALSGNELVVKNFLGEKVPRTIKFDQGVKVKISGDIIEIESPDIELAGRTASKFEGLTFVSKRDRRIFQDGIYITQKAGVDV